MKKIDSYFSKKSREQIETDALRGDQASRKRREERAAAEQVTAAVMETTVDVGDDIDVGDAALSSFNQLIRDHLEENIMDHLEADIVITTNVEQAVKERRPRGDRPSNWKEIATYYERNKKCRSTCTRFGLDLTNHDAKYWIATFSRWNKEIKSGREPAGGRTPIIGADIDNELVAEVRRYNLNGVPMTNLILRQTLIGLLQAHNQHDLLSRMVPDDEDNDSKGSGLRFGAEWCQRFYRRHKFPLKRATTKMREKILGESLGNAPTDEEAADNEAVDNDAAFDIEVNGSDEGAEHVERAPDIEEETVLRDAPRPLVTPRPRKRKAPERLEK